MKFIITESKLKNFINNLIGYDLSDKISIVTKYDDLPLKFRKYIGRLTINNYLERYGPIFIFETPLKTFLYQHQSIPIVVDEHDKTYSEKTLIKHLGIPPLGLSIDDIINIYFGE